MLPANWNIENYPAARGEMDRVPASRQVRTIVGGIVLGMAAADIVIVVAGLLSAGSLDRCHYSGEGAESTAFVAMMLVILVATVAFVLLARRLTHSWPLTIVILCVQLPTSVGFAFLPFVMRLGPAVCSG